MKSAHGIERQICGSAHGQSEKHVDAVNRHRIRVLTSVDGRRKAAVKLGSGDGPLSIRGCPSTVKGHPKILSKTASQKASSGPTP